MNLDDRSIDPAARQVLIRARELGSSTAWDRHAARHDSRPLQRQFFGLYATTSISTFASTISRASVVERAGQFSPKYVR